MGAGVPVGRRYRAVDDYGVLVGGLFTTNDKRGRLFGRALHTSGLSSSCRNA